MADTIVATQINCRQCAAPLAVEQGMQFVTCTFCGATNFVDKSRALFHYQVRTTIKEEGALSALRRWMAGNATVKGLDQRSKIGAATFQYFPMWLVRANQNGHERVLMKPAAALSVSELTQLNIPAADLVPFESSAQAAATAPTVPFEMMQQWLSDDQKLPPEMIRETALVHLPIYVCKYEYGGKRYTAVVDAATSKVFANVFPAKWEVPYVAIGGACFAAYFVLTLLSLFVSFGIFIIGAPILAVVFFALAATVSATV